MGPRSDQYFSIYLSIGLLSGAVLIRELRRSGRPRGPGQQAFQACRLANRVGSGKSTVGRPKIAPSWLKLAPGGPSWELLGPPLASWAAPGTSGAVPGAVLGGSWSALGDSWAALGPILGRSRPLWARSWDLLDLFWALLARSWQPRARFHENLDRTCVLRVRFVLRGSQVVPKLG